MNYGQCNTYGFSLTNAIRTTLTPKYGFIELGIPLPNEKSEEEM